MLSEWSCVPFLCRGSLGADNAQFRVPYRNLVILHCRTYLLDVTVESLLVYDFSGTHDPTAIFLASGPAFRHSDQRFELSILDVAPLLFHLVGEAIPDDLDGELPAELFSADWRAAHPPRRIAADAFPRPLDRVLPATGQPVADDQTISERLRALGYAK